MDEEYIKASDLVFYLTKEDIQNEAKEKLRRELNGYEMYQAKDFLEWGIMESIPIVYATIFNEIENNPKVNNEV